MSRTRATLACASLLIAAACAQTTPTTSPTALQVTDSFNGTLVQGGSATNDFTMAADGAISITLVSLSPQSTITMGVGIGTPSAATCVVTQSQENVKVGTPITGTLAAGSYCVELYDLGNMTGSDNYAITVVHS